VCFHLLILMDSSLPTSSDTTTITHPFLLISSSTDRPYSTYILTKPSSLAYSYPRSHSHHRVLIRTRITVSSFALASPCPHSHSHHRVLILTRITVSSFSRTASSPTLSPTNSTNIHTHILTHPLTNIITCLAASSHLKIAHRGNEFGSARVLLRCWVQRSWHQRVSRARAMRSRVCAHAQRESLHLPAVSLPRSLC
jgi:hypothetical protein